MASEGSKQVGFDDLDDLVAANVLANAPTWESLCARLLSYHDKPLPPVELMMLTLWLQKHHAVKVVFEKDVPHFRNFDNAKLVSLVLALENAGFTREEATRCVQEHLGGGRNEQDISSLLRTIRRDAKKVISKEQQRLRDLAAQIVDDIHSGNR